MLVRGSVAFEAGAPAFRDANLIVRLEDTSLADAPARIVAQTVLHGVSWSGEPAETLPFSLVLPDELPSGYRYELRGHVDIGRTGQVSKGDFVTTRSHPVDPSSGLQETRLHLHWLRP